MPRFAVYPMSNTPPIPDTPSDLPEPQKRHPKGGRGRGTTGRANAREAAAVALATGATFKAAAAAVGMHERTLRKWNDEDETFRALVTKLRADMVSEALGWLNSGMTEASNV